MKIRQVGAQFFHADGQTDMMKLTVAFRNFAYTPINECVVPTAGTLLRSDIQRINQLKRTSETA